jgi:beta-lactam-binding protein with PASTA domain
VAPIDFTDHFDATGRNIRNFTRHYSGDLEILHQFIGGATAQEKLFDLATVAINHPESLDNLPVAIINFFADDNLNDEKIAAIRDAWRTEAGTAGDFLRFLQAYAISTTFHRNDTFKYSTAFHRNMTLYNLNTVDNEEAYGNSFTPRSLMVTQGAEVFIPVHDVFGGQTSLNAANNPNLFKEAYNSSVDFPNRIAKTAEVCRDDAGTALGTWRKDWARVIPTTNGGYQVKEVGQWLWDRLVSDNRSNYGMPERAQVTALLATGMDFGYLVDPTNPDITYSANELETDPLLSIVNTNESALLDLDNAVVATRREANRRVGMAINFISMTPFMFASQGAQAIAPPSITVPDVEGLAEVDATAAIVTAGLTLGTTTSASSDTVPSGDVIGQNPAAGSSVVAGSVVDLVVSSGPAPVLVPDVGGQSTANATAAIVTAGLTLGTTTSASSDTVPNGDVIGQNPLAGSSVVAGSVVDLVVSSGPAPVLVPDVGGQSTANATAAIVTAGLTLGTTTSASSDTVPNGDVIGQNPLAGSSVVAGSVVDLVVSSGPAPTTADLLNCKEAVYKWEDREFLIEVKSSDRTGSRILNAVMDMDGDGVFELNLGVIPLNRGDADLYQFRSSSFVDPSPSASSMIRVTSDLGGVCNSNVKID